LSKKGSKPTSSYSFGRATRIDTTNKNIKKELGPGAYDVTGMGVYKDSMPS
jgi:hypothetical protein